MTRIAPALLALAAAAACTDAAPLDTPTAPGTPVSLLESQSPESGGSYLVHFTGGVPAGFAARVAALGGAVTFAHGGAGIGAVAGLSPAAAAELGRTPGVRAVADDGVTLLEGMAGTPASLTELAGEEGRFFAAQWNLRVVEAPAAWAAGHRGSPAVRIAFLDTGVDYAHPDLAGRVDLAASRSFVPSQDVLVEQHFPGAHPVADLHWHGTLGATAAAGGGVLFAGVAPEAGVIGIKVCTIQGLCPVSAVLAGLLHATDVGADVANLSLGNRFAKRDSTGAARPGPALVAVVQQALTYAHRQGMTVVVAAGNNATDLDHDRDDFRLYCGATAICVSATGPRASAGGVMGPFVEVDAPAPYTNYGRSAITVAAPGGTPAAGIPGPCTTFSLLFAPCRSSLLALAAQGTSFSAPQVAGAAALLVETVGRDPSRVRTHLERSADDLGEPGHDPWYGRGRLNVARAVALP
jgi:lantibiotic leader peptide-processing serine protease